MSSPFMPSRSAAPRPPQPMAAMRILLLGEMPAPLADSTWEGTNWNPKVAVAEAVMKERRFMAKGSLAVHTSDGKTYPPPSIKYRSWLYEAVELALGGRRRR